MKLSNIKKKLIPAVVHNDGTARVQSVSEKNNYLFKILKEYNQITNIPIIINTSFNIGGEAIVNSVEDAIESFKQMDIDYLVIEDNIFSKSKNFSKNSKSTAKFLSERKKRFKKTNNYPIINISYFNSNFYTNFFIFLKNKFLELIKYKKFF